MSSDANTQKMQMMLKALHYKVGTLDGISGKKTQDAIGAFQDDYGLKVTEKADQNTIDAMYAAFLDDNSDVYPDVLQLLLYYTGYYKSAIDGEIGRKTEKAISDFQGDNNLDETGEWDEDTLRKLKECLYS